MSSISKDLVQTSKAGKDVEPEGLDDLIKVPPYLGTKIQNTSNVNPNVPADSTLFQGKRGPGRPKKIIHTKVNGKTNFDKAFSAKADNQFHKSFNLAAKTMFASRVKSKKQKYRRPVVKCPEDPKKRRKKRDDSPELLYRNHKTVVSSNNLRGVHKKWLKKRKKHKRNTKERAVSPEFLKELEGLADLLSKKCVIEDKKTVSKITAPSTQVEVSR